MSESIRFVDLIQTRIDGFLDARASILVSIADELSPIEAFSRDFLSGGKRFRALFCYWGWQAVRSIGAGEEDAAVTPGGALDAVVSVAPIDGVVWEDENTRIPLPTRFLQTCAFTVTRTEHLRTLPRKMTQT